MGNVASTVAWQGQIGEEEVDGSEAAVKIVIKVGDAGAHACTDLLALQRPRSREDGDFRKRVEGVERSPYVSLSRLPGLEAITAVEVVLNLFVDHPDIGAEVLIRQADLDETLLLHEDMVGHIVCNTLAEDRGSEILEGMESE